MRRFIHAVAIAGLLAPASALAQSTGGGTVSGGAATNGGATPSGNASQGTGSRTAPPPSGPTAPAAAPAASAAPAPLPWRGTSFIWDHSVTPETLVPSTQLSADPSYQWWMSIRPRYQLAPGWSLRGRWDVTLEWYNSESTTRYREPQIGDIWLDLAYTNLPSFGGIRTTLGARVQLPVSYGSRARGTYFTLGGLVAFSRAWEHVLGNGFNIALAFVASHPFTSSTTASVVGPGYECVNLDYAPSRCAQVSGNMNTNFQLVTSLSLGWSPVERLDFGLSYIMIHQWAYNTPDTVINSPMGGTVTVARADDDTRLRQSSWFLASVDFEVAKWLSLSAGYYVFRSVLDPNGQYGNPFYSPGQNTRIFVTMTFALDEIYNAISGRNARPAAGGAGNARGFTFNRPRRSSPNDNARQIRQQQVQSGMFF